MKIFGEYEVNETIKNRRDPKRSLLLFYVGIRTGYGSHEISVWFQSKFS